MLCDVNRAMGDGTGGPVDTFSPPPPKVGSEKARAHSAWGQPTGQRPLPLLGEPGQVSGRRLLCLPSFPTPPLSPSRWILWNFQTHTHTPPNRGLAHNMRSILKSIKKTAPEVEM